jgi:hypothetical protein
VTGLFDHLPSSITAQVHGFDDFFQVMPSHCRRKSIRKLAKLALVRAVERVPAPNDEALRRSLRAEERRGALPRPEVLPSNTSIPRFCFDTVESMAVRDGTWCVVTEWTPTTDHRRLDTSVANFGCKGVGLGSASDVK